MTGYTKMACLVGPDGHIHDCLVTNESPAGMGFADASLALAQDMLFIPKRIDCEPVDGAKVVIPLVFLAP
jgi:hypothetical protein